MTDTFEQHIVPGAPTPSRGRRHVPRMLAHYISGCVRERGTQWAHCSATQVPPQSDSRMLAGDLSTMPLADLLQWADSSRAHGIFSIARPSGTVWMHVVDRSVVACGKPLSQAMLPEQLFPDIGDNVELEQCAVAMEMLFDQFLDTEDSFRFEPGAQPHEPGVPLDLSLQELVMNGMQWLDEWPRVRETYPNGRARMRRIPGPTPRALTQTQIALLGLAQLEVSLDTARLCLGISQPALLRNVEVLRRLDCVRVEGAPEAVDMIEQMVLKTLPLLSAKQFDEAAHVFAALLATTPGSKRLRELLHRVEREQIDDLYGSLPSDAVVHKCPRIALAELWLSRGERDVAERINGRWDVATIVLTCPMREIDTLKALRKLKQLEAIELVLAPAAPEPT